MKPKKRWPAVFLDRDGTLNNERKYLVDPKKIIFYRNVFEALRRLKKNGFKLVVTTNQSAIARGYLSLTQLNAIHRVFQKSFLKQRCPVDGFFFCPHAPDAQCSCRKPKPTLARRAARKFNIDLNRSYVVGDQDRDVEMARNIGAKGILVLTGQGREKRKSANKWKPLVTKDLLSASRWIIEDARKHR